MHSDPLLCGGLAAALRQHASFEIFVYGVDNLSSIEGRIDRSKHDNALPLIKGHISRRGRTPNSSAVSYAPHASPCVNQRKENPKRKMQ